MSLDILALGHHVKPCQSIQCLLPHTKHNVWVSSSQDIGTVHDAVVENKIGEDIHSLATKVTRLR